MADQNDEGSLPDGRRIPGDLIVSILTNLPVKSLLRFKAVSKRWYSFISSRRFIKMHLRRQFVIANKILLLSSRNNDRHQSAVANKLCYKFHILSDTTKQNDYWKIPPLLSYVADDLQIIALGSGLVCLRPTLSFSDPKCEGLILWNPATRKFRSLNSQPFTNIGIGYVEATDDYKIVVWSYTHTSVYSLNSDSWKNLDNDANQFPKGQYLDLNPFVFHGRMHWLVKTCTCCNAHDSCVNAFISIVAFDVADEVVSCLAIPDNCHPLFITLRQIQTLVIKGCFSLVIFSFKAIVITEMEIWVMEEYGVQKSWVKQFTIPGLPLPRVFSSFISWNDCEIVFLKDKYENAEYDENEDDLREMIMFYDPFTKKKYCLEFESLTNPRVFNFVESLASVGTEEEIATIKLVEV